MQVAVLSDETRTVEATVADQAIVVGADQLNAAIGWELKPEGLCRDDVCVPVRDRSTIEADGGIDLAAVAKALGRPAVASVADGVVAIGQPTASRDRALTGGEAVPFTLPDIQGKMRSLTEWRGKKKLLHVFASW